MFGKELSHNRAGRNAGLFRGEDFSRGQIQHFAGIGKTAPLNHHQGHHLLEQRLQSGKTRRQPPMRQGGDQQPDKAFDAQHISVEGLIRDDDMRPAPGDDARTEAALRADARKAQHGEIAVPENVDRLLQFRWLQTEHRAGQCRRMAGAGDAVIVRHGGRQEKFEPGDFFIAGHAFEAQASVFGGDRPGARDVIRAEGGDSAGRGLAEQAKNAGTFPHQATRQWRAQHVQSEHDFIRTGKFNILRVQMKSVLLAAARP